MEKYKIGEVVVCKQGEYIGRKLTIKRYCHEYYYHHTNFMYTFDEIAIKLHECLLIYPLPERDDNIDTLLQKKPKYELGDVVYCIPGKVYDYFLNRKLTINSVFPKILDNDIMYYYTFEEEAQDIKESALETLKEIRDTKLDNILNNDL